MNDKWECFLCCSEEKFEVLPYGYLSNNHPLCFECANSVLNDENHKQRFRLSYNKDIGDVVIAGNIPVQVGYHVKN